MYLWRILRWMICPNVGEGLSESSRVRWKKRGEECCSTNRRDGCSVVRSSERRKCGVKVAVGGDCSLWPKMISGRRGEVIALRINESLTFRRIGTQWLPEALKAFRFLTCMDVGQERSDRAWEGETVSKAEGMLTSLPALCMREPSGREKQNHRPENRKKRNLAY